MEGDFVQRAGPLGRLLATGRHLALLLAYLGREVRLYHRTRQLNLPLSTHYVLNGFTWRRATTTTRRRCSTKPGGLFTS